MRTGLVACVVVVSFGLGAWMSPRLQADTQGYVPVMPEPGDTVTLHTGVEGACAVESVSSVAKGWVRCNGVWWNLTTGVGYAVRARR